MRESNWRWIRCLENCYRGIHCTFIFLSYCIIWNMEFLSGITMFPSDNQPNSIECVASSPFQVVMYFITIRWLSCGKVLNRFYEMLTEIGQFVEQQKMEAQFELITPAWKHELFFFMALLITSMNIIFLLFVFLLLFSPLKKRPGSNLSRLVFERQTPRRGLYFPRVVPSEEVFMVALAPSTNSVTDVYVKIIYVYCHFPYFYLNENNNKNNVVQFRWCSLQFREILFSGIERRECVKTQCGSVERMCGRMRERNKLKESQPISIVFIINNGGQYRA